MTQHVVIRRESYVAGTRERPEVGIFTQAHTSRPPVPWGRVAVGDPVWMKWSGGPMVATARVQGFRQIENCTPEKLRATTTGFKLFDLDDCWRSLQPTFFAVTVYLEEERWLDRPFVPGARSRGESWIVLDRPELAEEWLNQREGGEDGGGSADRPVRTGKDSRTIGLALRFEVLRRDDFRCTYCGRRPPDVVLHLDHVVPWAAGGVTRAENLRSACSDCNLGKGARKLAASTGQ